MKKVIMFIVLFGMNALFAEEQSGGVKKNAQVERSVETLITLAQSGNRDALLEMGKKGDTNTIEILEKIRKEYDKDKSFGSVNACAQMALAKLGDEAAMREIVAEVKNDEPMMQNHAIKKLAYVGNSNAVKILVGLLENNKPREMKEWRGPKGEKPQGKLIYYPVNVIAMKALAEIIPNPIVSSERREPPNQQDIQRWREWWEKNKKQYSAE